MFKLKGEPIKYVPKASNLKNTPLTDHGSPGDLSIGRGPPQFADVRGFFDSVNVRMGSRGCSQAHIRTGFRIL